MNQTHPNRGKIRDWPTYVRTFRERHNLTQDGLARLLRVSDRNVENWEQGVRCPPQYLKLALAKIADRLTEPTRAP